MSAITQARNRFDPYLIEIGRRGLYARRGCPNLRDFAIRTVGLGGKTLRGIASVWRGVQDKPALKELFLQGSVGWSKIRVVLALATPETDGHWARMARSMSKIELETLVRDLKQQKGFDEATPTGQASAFNLPGDQASAFNSPGDQASAFNSPGDQASAFNSPGDQASAFNSPGDQASAFNSSKSRTRAFRLGRRQESNGERPQAPPSDRPGSGSLDESLTTPGSDSCNTRCTSFPMPKLDPDQGTSDQATLDPDQGTSDQATLDPDQGTSDQATLDP